MVFVNRKCSHMILAFSIVQLFCASVVLIKVFYGNKERTVNGFDGTLISRASEWIKREDSPPQNFDYIEPNPYPSEISKTESYMPHTPIFDGMIYTGKTYRFLSIREQVLSFIGEAKHGLWRVQENGMVRLYKSRAWNAGVPLHTDVYNPKYYNSIKTDYNIDAGYRFYEDEDGDGNAAFLDLPIYHPYFNGHYEDHVPIDLPIFYCTSSKADYKEAQRLWKYAIVQPNANIVGPLGKRAGLDIKENYDNAIKFDLFPDSKIWIQVGMGKNKRDDIFDQSDIDAGLDKMKFAAGFRKIDISDTEYEAYLVERNSWNEPYIFMVIVMDNKINDHLQYIRPAGLYWNELVKRNMTEEIKTEVTYNPSMSVIDTDGTSVTKPMIGAPFAGFHHPDTSICPNKGGDSGYYPLNPGGGGWPTNYEEVTTLCDSVVADVKWYANLDEPTWDSTTFQLYNGGTRENPMAYMGYGNHYGNFTDPYLVNSGIENPHTLIFTAKSNPEDSYVKIDVEFEAFGTVNKYVDTENGDLFPRFLGLTASESEIRRKNIDRAEKFFRY